MRVVACLFVLIGLSFVISIAQAQVPDHERQILIDFYHSTGGDDWYENDNWLGEPGTECRWHGVYCSCGLLCSPQTSAYVDGLKLSGNYLVGTIPDSIRSLDLYVRFDLSNNKLSGSLPDDLWNIRFAWTFDLSNNRFTGDLPFAILGAGPVEVDLSNNQFSGFGTVTSVLSEFWEPTVTNIHLTGNSFSEFPPGLWLQEYESAGLSRIDLSHNRLNGIMHVAPDVQSRLSKLLLAENQISELRGFSSSVFPQLEELDLSNNQLSEWPLIGDFQALADLIMPNNRLGEAWPPDAPGFSSLNHLVLRNNGIQGLLPGWFVQLEIQTLDVDNNSIEGPLSLLFTALVDSPRRPVRLYAANNRLNGQLPNWFNFDHFSIRQGRGPEIAPNLDLCGNQIALGNEELVNAVNVHQRGNDVRSCQVAMRHKIGPDISGSWFNPDRSGEGISHMLLDTGLVLSYWFTYPSRVAVELFDREQAWRFGVTRPNDFGYRVKPSLTTTGRFGSGLEELSSSYYWMDFLQIDDNTAQFFYSGEWLIFGDPITDSIEFAFDDRSMPYVRLSQLAGTDCANQTDHQWVSGPWFDPKRSGEGFILEAIDDDRVIVYWFTYTAEERARQAWMTGEGRFEDNAVHIETLFRPIGAMNGDDFDPKDVTLETWGSVSIEFSSDSSGHVSYESLDESYGSGEFPIMRLAQPLLAVCD